MTKGIASWGWSTVPQKHLNGRVLSYTQAKVLGGGSSINAQIYTRGHPADYDGWSKDGGDGWSYREVLPYFKRAEGNQRLDDDYHARAGPLGVSDPVAPLPICEAWFEAAGQLGIPFNPDFNGARQEGVGYYQLTQRNARRSSAASGPIWASPATDGTSRYARMSGCCASSSKGCRAIGVEVAARRRRDRERFARTGRSSSPAAPSDPRHSCCARASVRRTI